MTGRTALLHLCVAAAAIAAAVPAAHAQCRLCENPTTERASASGAGAISLQIETGLDFDRLVVIAPGEGSATLLPDGSRKVSGTITAISGRAMVGQVRIRGEAGRAVLIDLPDRVELFSVDGGRITIDEIVSDLPASPRLDGAGVLSFRFGGRLQVSGDAYGEFRGDVPITVDYL
jgi:hypothetical protein